MNQRQTNMTRPETAVRPEPIENLSDDEDMECGVCGGADRVVGEIRLPELPNVDEIRAHVARGHVPFRNW